LWLLDSKKTVYRLKESDMLVKGVSQGSQDIYEVARSFELEKIMHKLVRQQLNTFWT